MHGPLKGLFAWRFVVRAEDDVRHPDGRASTSLRQGVRHQDPEPIVANFILDTASPHTKVCPETLIALRYNGDMRPGQSATVIVQGVRTPCVVGRPGEANSIGAPFIVDGSLTFYFDHRLDAPVLYVDDENADLRCRAYR
ncbi:hypothetical protein BD626DRAFT_173987 [Schizophyllum amplum]|uniref:Uncharacterized protein n=1 Tax=Schizophyllum amplum TaxID=97359 RepID=A0A550C2H0_9AGAR|nr:hypothetical protein BD626DRAFT_173987 [Auriculariopsis ampla]